LTGVAVTTSTPKKASSTSSGTAAQVVTRLTSGVPTR
jgi:hypothetical protein